MYVTSQQRLHLGRRRVSEVMNFFAMLCVALVGMFDIILDMVDLSSMNTDIRSRDFP